MKTLMSFSVALLLSHWALSWTVIDPANLVQNTARVAKQIAQLAQSAERIKYEVNAAKLLLEKMKGLKISNISSLIGQINSFRSKSRAIGYSYENIEQQFEMTYGRSGLFSKNFQAWQKQADDGLKDAMISQGLIERSEKNIEDLEKIIKIKGESESVNDTLQAIGEINSIQAKQLADLSQIIATDARAKGSVIMEERAKNQELKNYEAHLMNDFNKHRKSRPLAYFPSLGSTAPRR